MPYQPNVALPDAHQRPGCRQARRAGCFLFQRVRKSRRLDYGHCRRQFLVDLEGDKALRAKLARKLAWLEKHQGDPSVVDGRGSPRVIPKFAHSTVIFADGTYRTCFVIDMSSTGVAVSADTQPQLGMPLAIGSCVGRVVRLFGEGFAVKFTEPQDPLQLESLVARAPRELSLLKVRPEAPPTELAMLSV